MKVFVHFSEIRESFKHLLVRFPSETILIVALASILSYGVHLDQFEGWLARSVYSLLIAFFFLVSTTLYRESRESRRWDPLLSLIPVAYGVLFYTVNSTIPSDSEELIILFLLHLFAFAVSILVAPYMRSSMSSWISWKIMKSAWKTSTGVRRSEGYNERGSGVLNAEFAFCRDSIVHSNYFTLIAWTKAMSGIVGLSTLLLGFIAISSVRELFDLSGGIFDGKIYGYWAVFSLSFVLPIYALMHFPVARSIRSDDYEVNRFFSFLIRFVGIPAISVYFVILYAYSVRVLIHFQDWPKGMISWLVIGFSIFGYLVYVFSEPYERDGKFIRIFRRYFAWAVLPQVVMLFYAIYLRIAQYDLTMNRYFVVIFGAWLALISLYLAISRRRSILMIPISLTLLSLVISIGPWSVFELPLTRQYDSFVRHATQAGILENGTIKKLDKTIDASLENTLTDEVRYICGYRDCEKFRPLFPAVFADNTKTTPWERAEAIREAMNVRYRASYSDGRGSKYQSISIDYAERDASYPIDIAGYEHLVQIIAQRDITAQHTVHTFISIDPNTDTLTLHASGATESVSLKPFTEKVRTLRDRNYATSPNNLIFTTSTEHYEVRLILESYAYLDPDYAESTGDNNDDYYTISGMALIREKK